MRKPVFSQFIVLLITKAITIIPEHIINWINKIQFALRSYCIRIRGPCIWNSVGPEITSTKSLWFFKRNHFIFEIWFMLIILFSYFTHNTYSFGHIPSTLFIFSSLLLFILLALLLFILHSLFSIYPFLIFDINL